MGAKRRNLAMRYVVISRHSMLGNTPHIGVVPPTVHGPLSLSSILFAKRRTGIQIHCTCMLSEVCVRTDGAGTSCKAQQKCAKVLPTFANLSSCGPRKAWPSAER